MEDKAAAEQAHELDGARLAELTEQRDQLQRLLQVSDCSTSCSIAFRPSPVQLQYCN